MNAGAPKGGAWGFNLATLSRLKSSKTVDNKSTLLSYLVKFIHNKWDNQPDSPANFVTEFAMCEEASKIESQFLKGEFNKIGSTLDRLLAELNGYKAVGPLDKFRPIMTGFHEAARLLYSGCQSMLEETEKTFAGLLTYLGETSAMQWEEFFAIWAEFIRDFAAENKRLIASKELLEKASTADARKAQRAAAKAEAAAKRAAEKVSASVEHAAADPPSAEVAESDNGSASVDFKKLDAEGQLPKPEDEFDGAVRSRNVSWSSRMMDNLKTEEGVRELQQTREKEEKVFKLENVSATSAKLAGGAAAKLERRRSKVLGSFTSSLKESVMGPPICGVCGCAAFQKHKFRPGVCSRCMHTHS